ncbi:protein moonraker-like isoform X2 [Bufo gargarizans]|uniref:protein moonraker-like isoform X2 n=1 Tax=Bufo gargarizans TaxID=30331 RepID=UPI001CF28472|nr:protein moonraker-like isoform X2 [Bufo gargarizans]
MALERLPSASAKGTQLRFNLDVVTHPTNLAAQYTGPNPIVIEKILRAQNKHADHSAAEDLLRNSCSSVSFSIVSEERLNLAVQLAKRDVKRSNLREKIGSKAQPQPKPGVVSSSPDRRRLPSKEPRANGPGKPEVTRSGARVYVYTPDRNRMDMGVSDSPPTRDPGPGGSPKKGMDPSEHEVRRLQKELHTYMKKIEDLAKKDHQIDFLDPSEEVRGRVRQQERTARSARMLYVLQQQVKEIQEDLEKLSPQKIRHTRKSRAMSRLAAVHRGAIRALQIFITQLSERGEQQIPSLYKELGHIIRQLSLCTAKLDAGPAASNLIISILQQVEDLDVLLEAKMSSDARRPLPDTAAARPPPVIKVSRNTASPVRDVHYPPPVHKAIEPHEESHVIRRLALDDPPESMSVAAQTDQQPSPPERRLALKSGLKALIQAGHLKGLHRSGVGQNKSKGVLIPQRPKGFRQSRKTDPSQRSHFQEKTVSFKLKETRPVVKEKKTPWVPPSPKSPSSSPKRSSWNPEVKSFSASPCKNRDLVDSSIRREAEKDDKENINSRLSWLDTETARRLQQLDNLYREEIAHLRHLREEAHAAKIIPDGSSNEARRQLAEDVLSGTERESLQELNLKEFSHSYQQPDSELEAMIQKMEEMEKYQEAVRQRFTRIVYSDPEFWAQEDKDPFISERSQAAIIEGPHSPHPIRITKPKGQREPVVDILLQEPFEGDSLQIHKEELARRSPRHFIQHPLEHTTGLLRLSVPSQMLQSIRNYTDNFDRHLRLTSHEEVGDFNPWHITESLAEELISDAVGEVAAELQDLCEGYAEAVFTSEFMEPSENN